MIISPLLLYLLSDIVSMSFSSLCFPLLSYLLIVSFGIVSKVLLLVSSFVMFLVVCAGGCFLNNMVQDCVEWICFCMPV